MEKINASALVIDDQEEMLLLCTQALGELVTEVHEAQTSSAARELFHRRSFDLVLTDINIDKDGDGVALAQEIKNLSPDTKVIMMTADPALETAIGGIKSGVLEYIIKPFSLEYLNSVVHNVFEKAKLSSELEREKSMKQELEAAYAQLKSFEKTKDSIIARVNHELRTPMAIALASSEMLGQQLKEARDQETWDRSHKALRALQLALGELLTFSELLKGEMKADKKPTDLWDVLGNVSASLKFLYDDMQTKVELLREGEPYEVMADPELVSEAFRQLLVNAVKFNKKGGSITVKAHYGPERAVFAFSDTGPGVSDEAMPHLFDSFFQAADYLTREVGGIGLGLAIVKQIAEVHGGAVAAQKNLEGGGMTFSVSIPKPAARA